MIGKKSQKSVKRDRRRIGIRYKVKGTAKKPRLSVFRSHKHIYAQLINDEKKVTLVAANELKIDKKTIKDDKEYKAKKKVAFEVGVMLAKEAAKKNIKSIVFDRGGYKYHGRVKALAEGARKGGLKF